MTILDDARFHELLRARAEEPHALVDRAERRRRRPMAAGDGNVLIVAFDHPARRIPGVGSDTAAMADRRTALERRIRALRRSLLYRADGQVERWVDVAATIVHGDPHG